MRLLVVVMIVLQLIFHENEKSITACAQQHSIICILLQKYKILHLFEYETESLTLNETLVLRSVFVSLKLDLIAL
jgi:hypothetical protein